ncbi:MAG: glycosyltransferase family 9 protein [Gammaproteobacteria bacterium]
MTTSDHNTPALLVYVHEDRLGDALLKLPAVSTLREAFPGFHITWLAGSGPSMFRSGLAPLVASLIDQVEDRTGLGCRWNELLHRPLVDRYYDVIIDTQTVLRSTLVVRRVAHGLFISPAARFLFSDKRPGPEGFGGSMRDRLLQLIRLASGRAVRAHRQLQLPQEYRRLAADLLPQGRDYIGLAPGAGGRDKCWPLERFIQLGRDQQAKGRLPVYFPGPDEMEWLPIIREQVPGALIPEAEAGARPLAGPLLCMALAERLSLGVANDSGTGHIFAISGAPLVSLFGRTSVEKFVDSEDNRIVLAATAYGGRKVEDIPLAAVIEAVDKQFGASA